MRLLADENFPRAATEALQGAGYEIASIRTDAPGSSDEDVLLRSIQEERVLVTFDKDFGELVFLRGSNASCGVILFRIPFPSPEETASFVLETLCARADWQGHFSVVDTQRVRMRRLAERKPL